MLLPGPEAQQFVTYMGWLLHRTWGGIVAGTLFVLPGFIIIVALSILYAMFHEITLVQGLFFGIKAAVLVGAGAGGGGGGGVAHRQARPEKRGHGDARGSGVHRHLFP